MGGPSPCGQENREKVKALTGALTGSRERSQGASDTGKGDIRKGPHRQPVVNKTGCGHQVGTQSSLLMHCSVST